MEANTKKIREYIDLIVERTGKTCSADFDGILAVVKFDGQIIFTTAGGLAEQRIKNVETLLGGMAIGLAIGIGQERSKMDGYYSIRN